MNRLININNISTLKFSKKNNLSDFENITYLNSTSEGGFGSIHEILKIDNNKINNKYLLKIFRKRESKKHAYDVIKALHEKLKKQNKHPEISIYHQFPELLGLPFATFYATIEESGEQIVAFLMFNLSELGFEDYGSDDNISKDYFNLDLTEKLYLAYQLSKAVDLFHNINYIHSDIKEAALFINVDRRQIAIIDYDSGYHFDLQSKPITIGAIGQWLSKKWRETINKKNKENLTFKDRLNEEKWLLANAIFELLFNVPPYFFLKDVESQEEYLANNTWPKTGKTTDLYNTNNLQYLNEIENILEQLKNAGFEKLVNAFSHVFNLGYKDENKRLSAKKWKDLLEKINTNNCPEISSFTSDKTEINKKNETVKTKWFANKYNYLIINNEIVDLNKKSHYLTIEDEAEITLKAVNDFSETTEKIKIKANKIDPEFVIFDISHLIRKDKEDKIKVKWEASNAKYVKISGIDKKFGHKGTVELTPNSKTIYSITAFGYFDQKLKKEFELDVAKVTIHNFDASKKQVINHNPITINWSTNNTDYILLNSEKFPASGKTQKIIKKDTKFTLEAIGIFGDRETKNLLIKTSKEPPVIETFYADKLFLKDDSPVILTWEVINAQKVTITGLDDVPHKGSNNIKILKDTTITIEAISFFGIRTKRSLQIEVSKAPPQITKFEALHEYIFEDRYTDLSWGVKNAKEIRISNIDTTLPNSGTINYKITKDSQIKLEATSYFGFKSHKYINIKTIPVPLLDNLFVTPPAFNLKLKVKPPKAPDIALPNLPNLNYDTNLSQIIEEKEIPFILTPVFNLKQNLPDISYIELIKNIFNKIDNYYKTFINKSWTKN